MPYKLLATIPYEQPANSVAASERFFASVCDDGKARLYDAATLAEVKASHVGVGCRALAFSPDGSQLACGAKALQLFDVETHKKIGTFKGHRHTIQAAAFSPAGGTLVTVSGDRFTPADWSVRRWSVGTGAEQSRWKEEAPIFAVAVSPDGARVATAGQDSHFHLYDLATGRVVWRQAHTAWNYALAFTPDGRFLISVGDTPGIRVINASTGRLEHLLQSDASARSFALSPSGASLVLGANRYDRHDARVVVLDLATGELLEEQPLMEGLMIQSVGFSPDGSRIYAALSFGRESAPDGLRVYERTA